MQLRIATAMLLCVLAGLAGQEPAAASTLTRSGTELTYTAAAGVANQIYIDDTSFGVRIVDAPETIVVQDPAPGGCYQSNAQAAWCPPELGITKVIVNAGDKADTVVGAGLGRPLEIDGGSGSDVLMGSTLDDQIDARDGEADLLVCDSGNDTADVDVVDEPTFGCEQVTHSIGVVTYDGSRILVDAADGVANVLEVTKPGGPGIRLNDSFPLKAGLGCTQSASNTVFCDAPTTTPVHMRTGDLDDTVTDKLPGTYSGTVTIEGGSGNDTITGGAPADDLIGGSGDDRLTGGGGIDALSGGEDIDYLDAADAAHDGPIDCGTGSFDSVVRDAAPLDDPVANCEITNPEPSLANQDATPGASGTYKFVSGAGQDSDLFVERISTPGTNLNAIRFTDTGTQNGGGLIALKAVPGQGCANGPAGNQVTCAAASPPVTVEVFLGDGNDRVRFKDDPNAIYAVVYGGSGNDDIGGTDLTSVLAGDDGADVLRGLEGDDALNGGDGSDTFYGGTGKDSFFGGLGSGDLVDYSSKTEDIVASADGAVGDGPAGEDDNVDSDVEGILGGSGNDTLIGNDFANFLVGGPGDDSISGLAGDDVLLDSSGGPENGDDEIEGGSGNDTIASGIGDDVVDGGSGTDGISGGDGRDRIDYSASLDGVAVRLDGSGPSGSAAEGDSLVADFEEALGGQGNDSLVGNAADNLLFGGAGNDSLAGNGGGDQLHGDDGDDVFDGGAGADSFVGSNGTDEVTYAASSQAVAASLNGQVDDGAAGEGDSIGSGIEVLRGGSGNDALTGDDAANSLIGGDGNDVLSAAAGVDFIDAGNGDDSLAGGAGNDNLRAGAGNDEASGDDGQDTVAGEAGADRVAGGNGSDIINGGSGNDGLNGRDGTFDVVSCGTGSDVTDVDGIDQLGADCDPDTVIVSAASISSTSLQLSKGKLRVKVRCRATGATCEGKLSIASKGRVRTSKAKRKKKLKIGERSFSIASGQQASIAVPVAKAARKALAATGRMPVIATLTIKDGKALTRTLTVTAPRKKKGKRR